MKEVDPHTSDLDINGFDAANTNHTGLDISKRIDLRDPRIVQAEIKHILSQRFVDQDLSIVDQAFDHFVLCYSGGHEDYYEVETLYHNVQHVMDVTLATVRLMEGYQKVKSNPALDADKVLLAFIVAIFHDAGYLRYRDDFEAKHGAEHTRIHVSRSGMFLKRFLLETTLSHYTDIALVLVQYTGLEQKIEDLHFENNDWLLFGDIIGTADLIAQMSDRDYAQKCCAHLYEELCIAGLTEKTRADGSTEVVYSSGDDLLQKTPFFIEDAIENRLRLSFNRVYEYAAVYFGGRNLYMEGIEKNRALIVKLTP